MRRDTKDRGRGHELRIHSVPTRVEQLRTTVEIVAIVAAGLSALYTFVYEQKIKPLTEDAAWAVPTSVDQGPTVRARLGGYDLQSSQLRGEYDSANEYSVRP